MILVDTSVWIDHFHRGDTLLLTALNRGQVLGHPLVIEELALGSIKNRSTVLRSLADLPQAPVISHDEVMATIDGNDLWGRGLSASDIRILGSSLVVLGCQLYTRDRKLKLAAQTLGVEVVD